MTAPLFLVPPGSLDGAPSTLLLDGPEGHHAASVQRLAVGEEVLVADGTGRAASCRVAQVRPGALDLQVEATWESARPEPRMVLVQALAKGDRDLMAVEAATELDVDEVVPWQADRSIVRWRGDRGAKSHRRWEQTVRAASKQSRRVRVPDVAPAATLHTLLDRTSRAALTVVLHESAEEPLTGLELPAEGEVLLVVGPEGGVSTEELDALTGAGARAARLGRNVLRSSTAGPAALAVLNARGRWR